jgi:four helix bundle protein
MTEKSKYSKQYDLEERTSSFGENVIKFIKKLKINLIYNSLIIQLMKSATSIGANYMEANGASSKKDFRNKISICKKESKETKHWLRMMLVVVPEEENDIKILWKEAQELTLIFGKILSTASK